MRHAERRTKKRVAIGWWYMGSGRASSGGVEADSRPLGGFRDMLSRVDFRKWGEKLENETKKHKKIEQKILFKPDVIYLLFCELTLENGGKEFK